MPGWTGLEYQLLGSLVVTRSGHEIPMSAPKQRALLAILLMSANRTVPTEILIDRLWDGMPPPSARAALQVHVAKLRDLLGEDVIETTTAGYLIHVESNAIDVGRYDELAAAGHRARLDGDSQQAVATLHDALAEWRGEALAEFSYSDWTQSEIRRLEESLLQTRTDLLAARLDCGDGRVLSEIAALATLHPLSERVKGLHAEALYRSGRQTEALASLEETRTRLREELGLDLSPELKALEERILLHAVGPPRRLGRPPIVSTTFVGRDHQLAQLRKLIEDERLVTVIGPPGVGKSRLMTEVCRRLDDQPITIWWIQLSAVQDGSALVGHVLRSGGFRELPGTTSFESLVVGIGRSPGLLVLDTCEHLLAAIADLVSALLERCPSLRIVTTSRERLHLHAETVYPVGPLLLPDPADSTPELAPSVRLLCDRAGVVIQPELASRLSTSLNGLPLAIELAAARIAEIGEDRVARDASDFLSDLSEEQVLVTTLEWSYGLLGTRARALFDRLGFFPASFDLDGVIAVCTSATVAEEDVLDLMNALIDKSLVVAEPTELGIRFRLLDTIRAYARTRFSMSEVEERFSRHYLGLVVDARDGLRGGESQLDLRNLIEVELPNLVVAAEGDAKRGSHLLLRATSALMPFWLMSAKHELGIQLTELALSSQHDADPCSVVEAMATLARLTEMDEDQEGAEALGERAVELAKERCPAARYLGHFVIAHANMNYRNPVKAAEYGRIAAKGAGEAGDDWTQAWALLVEGVAIYENGRPTEAQTPLNDARQIFEKLGDLSGLAWVLWSLASSMMYEQRPSESSGLFQDALALFRRADDPMGVSVTLGQMAMIERQQGRPWRAIELGRQALPFHRLAGQVGNEICEYGSMALASLDHGDSDQAAELVEKAIGLVAIQHYWAVLNLVLPVGALLRNRGRSEEAAPLVLAALRHWEERGLDWEVDLRESWERLVEDLETDLGRNGVESAALTASGLTDGDVLDHIATLAF
jgi:predicted ATPase